MDKKLHPLLGLAVGVIAVSFSPILTKVTLQNGVHPVIIAFYRLLFTTLILVPLTFLSDKNRDEFKSLGKREYIIAIFSGIFLAFHFVAWFISLTKTSVFSATLLVDTHPIFVVLLQYILFKEKITVKGLIAMLIAIFGIALIGWGDFRIGQTSWVGNGYALLGAISVSSYFLCGSVLRRKMSLFTYSFTVYGICTLVLFIWALAARLPLFAYSLQDYLIFLSLAIVCTIFGHTIFNWALKYLKASVISVSILGEPIGAAILAFFIFHEIPGLMVLFGGFIVLIGVFMFHVVSTENKK